MSMDIVENQHVQNAAVRPGYDLINPSATAQLVKRFSEANMPDAHCRRDRCIVLVHGT